MFMDGLQAGAALSHCAERVYVVTVSSPVMWQGLVVICIMLSRAPPSVRRTQ